MYTWKYIIIHYIGYTWGNKLEFNHKVPSYWECQYYSSALKDTDVKLLSKYSKTHYKWGTYVNFGIFENFLFWPPCLLMLVIMELLQI